MTHVNPEFMWAVGLFEGEGCAGVHKAGTKKGAHVRDVRLVVVSTDLDVLEKFNRIIGYGKVVPMSNASSLGKKFQWQWKLSKQMEVNIATFIKLTNEA